MSLRGRCFVGLLAISLPYAPGQTPAPPAIHGAAPAVSPDGTKIAFLSDRDGATDLYVVAADGTGEIRLTHTPETESQPDWSADGKRIWFTVFSDGSSRIFSIGPDGNDRKVLGTVPGRALRLSPDGKAVLFWTGTWTAMKLFVSDLDGSHARELTDGSGAVWGARWSPDGKRIAFGDRDSSQVLQVHLMNADGSGRRQMTHFASSDGGAQMPAWSPDGAQLAVQAGAKGKPSHLWVVDASTGAARKLAAHDDEPFHDEVPAWFAEGRRIAL